MSEVGSMQIRCEQCNKWFNSPFFFDYRKAFDTSELEGNTVQCPHCKKMTGYDKDNMGMRWEDDGGFVDHKT